MSEENKKDQPNKNNVNRVLEILEGGELIDKTIESFSEGMESPMSDEQKQAMKKYAVDMSEKWHDAILKFEKAIQDPKVQEILEKKLKNLKKNTEE